MTNIYTFVKKMSKPTLVSIPSVPAMYGHVLPLYINFKHFLWCSEFLGLIEYKLLYCICAKEIYKFYISNLPPLCIIFSGEL